MSDEMENSKILQLHDIRIDLSAPPHKDIPDDAKLFAQIIINHFIFAQTTSVESTGEKRGIWELRVDCAIPGNICIAVLREGPPRITRLLGSINIGRELILDKATELEPLEISLPMIRVNSDGPLVTMKTMFSVHTAKGPRAHGTRLNPFEVQYFQELCLDPSLEAVNWQLSEMHESLSRGKEVDALQIAIMYEKLLWIPSPCSEDKAKLLNMLGDICFRQREPKEVDNLHRAVDIYGDAVRESEHTSGFEATYWNNLALALKLRFEQLGNIPDVDRAIQLLEEVSSRTSDASPAKALLLYDLADSLLDHFLQLGNLSNLKRSIQTFQRAVELIPDESPNKAPWLHSHGIALIQHFEQAGDLSDLQKANRAFEEALELSPKDDPHRPFWLWNLGDGLWSQFQRLGDVLDLTRSIDVKEQAVELLGDDHPDKALWCNELGVSLLHQFEYGSNLLKLKKSIQVIEHAVELTPDHHPDKASWLNSLGYALWTRFEQLGDLPDLNRSIQAKERAVKLTAHNHPKKAFWFHNLGISLLSRFEQLGDPSDLKTCVQVSEQAVELIPDDHRSKPALLNGLGNSYWMQFEKLGDSSNLNKSIQILQRAIELMPDDDPDKASGFQNLGNSLLSRFELHGELEDLNRSVQVKEQAVALTSDTHPCSDKASRLSNLAISLAIRFEQLGDPSDLSKSIQIFQQAIELTSDDNPDKPVWFNNLGLSLLKQSQQLDDSSTLNQSIHALQQAVELTPNNHPNKPSWCNNLGESLLQRFEQLGDLADLNQSIQVIEQVIKLHGQDNNPDRPSWFNNLGNALAMRFKRLGDLADLNRAIQVKEQATDLTPDYHPDKASRLNNLAMSLAYRYSRLANFSDLSKSIGFSEHAIKLTPNNHPAMAFWLNNLGLSLTTRFLKLEELSDLETSIQLFEQTIKLMPDSHPGKGPCFNHLGISLLHRFHMLGDRSDLVKSIQVSEQAIELIPDGQPDKALCLYSLGNSLTSKFQTFNDYQAISSALDKYSLAAKYSIGFLQHRFQAAQSWMKFAQIYAPDQAMESCRTAMTLIPQLIPLGASIADWHYQIKSAGLTTRQATAVAITAEKYDTALEWLEQGRSIVWNQLLHLRSPVDDLRQAYPELASQFQLLSLQLEESTIQPISSNSLTQVAAEDYHELARKRSILLQDIRQHKGFERFLLHKTISELQPAAKDGPIVMLNLSGQGIGGLILCPDIGVLHLALPLGEVLQDLLEQNNHANSSRYTIVSSTQLEDSNTATSAGLLSTIWHNIGRRVLDSLGITTPMQPGQPVRRIWWCPTGRLSFLPVHAAGVYPDGPKLSDFVVSSYTPTISALLNIRRTESVTPSQLLTVSLPIEAGLPSTEREVQRIAIHSSGISVRNLCEGAATAKSVSEGMVQSEWAHFACHGKQDHSDPTQSSLQLANRSTLKLSDIINLRLENAQLAFLSACETATGDAKLEDEAVHLAAGMLLAGYRSVIATMHAVEDDYAADIADDTYRRLFEEYGADFTRAAEALHFAVQKVRQESESQGDFSFAWVPFIHMGI